MWIFDTELSYNQAIERFQPFLDEYGPWMTVNYVATHYEITQGQLMNKVYSNQVPSLLIDDHYYISRYTIETIEGLQQRPKKSTVHKDQTSFLNLVDMANEIEVAS